MASEFVPCDEAERLIRFHGCEHMDDDCRAEWHEAITALLTRAMEAGRDEHEVSVENGIPDIDYWDQELGLRGRNVHQVIIRMGFRLQEQRERIQALEGVLRSIVDQGGEAHATDRPDYKAAVDCMVATALLWMEDELARTRAERDSLKARLEQAEERAGRAYGYWRQNECQKCHHVCTQTSPDPNDRQIYDAGCPCEDREEIDKLTARVLELEQEIEITNKAIRRHDLNCPAAIFMSVKDTATNLDPRPEREVKAERADPGHPFFGDRSSVCEHVLPEGDICGLFFEAHPTASERE